MPKDSEPLSLSPSGARVFFESLGMSSGRLSMAKGVLRESGHEDTPLYAEVNELLGRLVALEDRLTPCVFYDTEAASVFNDFLGSVDRMFSDD